MENSKPSSSLYQRFLTYEYSDLEINDLRALLQEGLDAIKHGDVRPAEDVFSEIEAELNNL